MTQTPLEFDVRPILHAGSKPFTAIMDAVEGLDPGRALRLLATFEFVLYDALAERGLDHAAREIGGGNREASFTPWAASADPRQAPAVRPEAGNVSPSGRAEPSRHLDNRNLEPLEPLVRTLGAIEQLQPGENFSALLCRDSRLPRSATGLPDLDHSECLSRPSGDALSWFQPAG